MTLHYRLIVLTLLLTVINLPAHAGKIYRFLDKSGVSTMSKSLPPYAAQQGYDILDDKSLRVIERVMSSDEKSKLNAEAKRLALILEDKKRADEEAARLARIQRINDRGLLDRYPDDRVLINARDTDLSFLKKQISEVTNHKDAGTERLYDLQQQAADLELSGQAIDAAFNQKLALAQKEIDTDQVHLERLQSDLAQTEAQYKVDLVRLRELLGLPTPESETTP